jgi:hypothetical protein
MNLPVPVVVAPPPTSMRSATTSPLPATARTPARTGSSRQSPQGSPGAPGRPPAVAAASALMELAAGPRTNANAYWTGIGGVVICTAVEPAGQPAPRGGRWGGRRPADHLAVVVAAVERPVGVGRPTGQPRHVGVQVLPHRRDRLGGAGGQPARARQRGRVGGGLRLRPGRPAQPDVDHQRGEPEQHCERERRQDGDAPPLAGPPARPRHRAPHSAAVMLPDKSRGAS